MSCFRFFVLLTIFLMARVADAESPTSFAYVLQADTLAKTRSAVVERLATCGRDWLVLDAAFSDTSLWDREELDQIRAGQQGRKVVAYLSIGEAEDYRSYWQEEWLNKGELSGVAPAWLVEENPDWEGNYRVKYWHAEWQKLIFTAVDSAMESGFDGLYLDIVDGFETFEQQGREFVDDRPNPVTKQTFRRDMVDWVKAVAARARAKHPDALVIPQNGLQLLAHPDYLAAISAVGIEDLFTDGNKLQPKSHTRDILQSLRGMTVARKPVLLIEYPTRAKQQTKSKKRAREHGLIWLTTDRQLRTLGVSGK